MKIFVSYTSSDRDWAHWIGWHLREAGYVPFIHEWEVQTAESIPQWMSERLEEADRFLGVFSDAYCEATYSKVELGAALWHDPDGRKGFVIPIEARKVATWPFLMAQRKRLSLVGLDEKEALRRLLDFMKPAAAASEQPPFPADATFTRGSEPLAAAPPSFPDSRSGPVHRPTSRRRWWLALAIVALIVALLAGLLRLRSKPEWIPVQESAVDRIRLAQSGPVQLPRVVPGDLEGRVIPMPGSNPERVVGLPPASGGGYYGSPVRVWDRRSGKLIKTYGGRPGIGAQLRFVQAERGYALLSRDDDQTKLVDLATGAEHEVRMPLLFDEVRAQVHYSNGHLGIHRPDLRQFEVWSLHDGKMVMRLGAQSTHRFWYLPSKEVFVSSHAGGTGPPFPAGGPFVVHWKAKPGENAIVSVVGTNTAAPAFAEFLHDRSELLIRQPQSPTQTMVQRWSLPPGPKPVFEKVLPGDYHLAVTDGYAQPFVAGRPLGIMKLDDLSWVHRLEPGQNPFIASRSFPIVRAWYERPGAIVLWRPQKELRREFPSSSYILAEHRAEADPELTRLIVSNENGFQLWDLTPSTPVLLLERPNETAQFTTDFKAVLARLPRQDWHAYDLRGSLIANLKFSRDIHVADYQSGCQFLVWTNTREFFRISNPPGRFDFLVSQTPCP